MSVSCFHNKKIQVGRLVFFYFFLPINLGLPQLRKHRNGMALATNGSCFNISMQKEREALIVLIQYFRIFTDEKNLGRRFECRSVDSNPGRSGNRHIFFFWPKGVLTRSNSSFKFTLNLKVHQFQTQI